MYKGVWCGFAVKTSITTSLGELTSGVSDRIITMRLPLLKGRFVECVCSEDGFQ